MLFQPAGHHRLWCLQRQWRFEVDHVAMVVGAKDPVVAFGGLLIGSLSLSMEPLARPWPLHRFDIPAMNHNGNAGPFSIAFRVKVVESICRELTLTQGTLAKSVVQRRWSSPFSRRTSRKGLWAGWLARSRSSAPAQALPCRCRSLGRVSSAW